jgi:hypothetical protein
MAHTCNPSYLDGRDQQDHGLKPAWANWLWDPILIKPNSKKGWWSSLRCRSWVQAPAPKKKKMGTSFSAISFFLGLQPIYGMAWSMCRVSLPYWIHWPTCQSSQEIPLQSYPEVLFTNFLGISWYSQVDNQDKPSQVGSHGAWIFMDFSRKYPTFSLNHKL